jgi:hypothetical protein
MAGYLNSNGIGRQNQGTPVPPVAIVLPESAGPKNGVSIEISSRTGRFKNRKLPATLLILLRLHGMQEVEQAFIS